MGPHGHYHPGDLSRLYVVGQNVPQLLRSSVVVVLREQDPRLLLVAHEAGAEAQKVPPFHGDTHVGHSGKHRLAVFFRVVKDRLYDLLVTVDLQGDAVGIAEDLVSVIVQNVHNRPQIRPLGNGGHHVAAVVENGQPGAHAVRHGPDVIRVDLVVLQLADHVRSSAGGVHQTDEGGPQLHVGNVLHQIPADAAVDDLHPSGVPPTGNIYIGGIPLNIHENGAQHHNTHSCSHPSRLPANLICFC